MKVTHVEFSKLSLYKVITCASCISYAMASATMVGSESRKIRKKPVIIYLESPKVIHVEPTEFMGLVQRLTGRNASSESAVSNNSHGVERDHRLQSAELTRSSHTLVSSDLNLLPCFGEEKGGSVDSGSWFLWEDC